MDRRSKLKRKLDTDHGESDERDRDMIPASDLADEILRHVAILNKSVSYSEANLTVLKDAAHALSKLVMDKENIDIIVKYEAVPALVKHLRTYLPQAEVNDSITRTYKHETQIECMIALGHIAIKAEYKQLIVDTGAVSHLVNLLKRREVHSKHQSVNDVIRGAADLISKLAYENPSIKARVRIEGGIRPLIELLEFGDSKEQMAAVGALQTLAKGNNENNNQIIELGALSSLTMLLHSDDTSIHYKAICVITNLVCSSQNLKKEVLQAGALQPVIRLLSSSCIETQRQAALLIAEFASADANCKTQVVKRGAITPVIKMLHSSDDILKDRAALVLGHLAHKDKDIQAGIGCSGAIEPLLSLLDRKTGSSQFSAAFALCGLAGNKENVVDFVKAGAVQKLQEGQFIAQPTRDYVSKTLQHMEEKIQGRVLKDLLCVMKTAKNSVQKRVALTLAHLCNLEDGKLVFVNNNGLELLLELLDSADLKEQQSGLTALYKLTNDFDSSVPKDMTPPSPAQHVCLGQKFLNDPILSDVTFVIEGEPLYAHKICLVASSDAFRAMFYSGYKERDAQEIVITNIKRNVFELMMRFIYTGSVDVNTDVAQDLLRAADQYLLEGLKRICEHKIAQDISIENVRLVYELADESNAMILRRSCASFVLQHSNKLSIKPWFSKFVRDIIPGVRSYAINLLES